MQAFNDVLKAVLREGACSDRLAPSGLFGELRNVQVAVQRQKKGARDWRRGHDQDIGISGFRLLLQRKALRHPEPVLLIDHGKTQIVENDIGFNNACVPTMIWILPEASWSSSKARAFPCSRPER